MIKLVIFDLDGVLVDSREMHYQALNRALESIDPKFVIGRDEHLAKYDGLNTTKKLKLLTASKGLPEDKHAIVWSLKQSKTWDVIRDTYLPDPTKCEMFQRLKADGYTVAVASNSVRPTVRLILSRKGFIEWIDFYYSNEDVIKPKPAAEMYLRVMLQAGVNPKETVIVEDSHMGRQAALDSGAHLCAVADPTEVNYERVKNHIVALDKTGKQQPKWNGGNMNVLIPMAGAGSRFEKAGYTFPKPLIEVEGKPMIQLIVENLNIHARHIFIVQQSHYEKYNLKQLLNLVAPGCEIVRVNGLTEGAACTTLLAKHFIDNNEPLVIANSDQFIEWDSSEFMWSMSGDTVDAGILTFTATHPKWSFARLDDAGFVCEVAEKKPISDIATVGVYYWRRGSDYVRYAEQMLAKNVRVNNEFYVCPVFNEAIADGKRVKTYHIDRMWGIGTPEDLAVFLQRQAAQGLTA